MEELKVGDRIKCIKPEIAKENLIGTVVEIYDETEIFVQFDKETHKSMVSKNYLEKLKPLKKHPLYELEFGKVWHEDASADWKKAPGGWIFFDSVFKTTFFIPYNEEFIYAPEEK